MVYADSEQYFTTLDIGGIFATSYRQSNKQDAELKYSNYLLLNIVTITSSTSIHNYLSFRYVVTVNTTEKNRSRIKKQI